MKFAPGAYKDPYSYVGKDETKTDVELLIAYMTDDTGKVTNPGLKNDIRDTVIATWKVEDLWLRDKIDLTQYLVWRFIGTSNGVVRSSPGVVMDKRYDPRQRPWLDTVSFINDFKAIPVSLFRYFMSTKSCIQIRKRCSFGPSSVVVVDLGF